MVCLVLLLLSGSETVTVTVAVTSGEVGELDMSIVFMIRGQEYGTSLSGTRRGFPGSRHTGECHEYAQGVYSVCFRGYMDIIRCNTR